MTRRTYGSGSVYRRASDGRWFGTIEHGYTRTGARKRVTVSAKTEAEATARLEAKARELARALSAVWEAGDPDDEQHPQRN